MTNVPKVEIYKDGQDQWRWRLQGENGETVAVGESHSRKADAERAAKTAKRLMETAETVVSKPSKRR